MSVVKQELTYERGLVSRKKLWELAEQIYAKSRDPEASDRLQPAKAEVHFHEYTSDQDTSSVGKACPVRVADFREDSAPIGGEKKLKPVRFWFQIEFPEESIEIAKLLVRGYENRVHVYLTGRVPLEERSHPVKDKSNGGDAEGECDCEERVDRHEYANVITDTLGLPQVRTTILALSGGGFRALLFHIGLIRCLYDTKKLQDVREVVGVSGGGIVAAYLAAHWEDFTHEDEARFAYRAEKLVALSRENLRGRIIAKFLLWAIPAGALVWLLWAANRVIQKLASPIKLPMDDEVPYCSTTYFLIRRYEKLFEKRMLSEFANVDNRAKCSAAPEVHLLATGLKEGSLCSFSRKGFSVGAAGTKTERHLGGSMYSISRAVAATSAFPPVFPPIRVTPETLGIKANHQFSVEYLSDGGLFDNTGVRKVYRALRRHANINHRDSLVLSDAGAPFEVQYDRSHVGIIKLMTRAPDILMRRVTHLENEAAVAAIKNGSDQIRLDVIECKITDTELGPRENLNVHPEYQKWLPNIRTDFDSFSAEEISSLVRHGYAVTRSELLEHCRQNELVSIRKQTERSWDPIASIEGNSTPRAEMDNEACYSNGVALSTAAPHVNFIKGLIRGRERRFFHPSLFKCWECIAIVSLLVVAAITAIGIALSGLSAKETFMLAKNARHAAQDLNKDLNKEIDRQYRADLTQADKWYRKYSDNADTSGLVTQGHFTVEYLGPVEKRGHGTLMASVGKPERLLKRMLSDPDVFVVVVDRFTLPDRDVAIMASVARESAKKMTFDCIQIPEAVWRERKKYLHDNVDIPIDLKANFQRIVRFGFEVERESDNSNRWLGDLVDPGTQKKLGSVEIMLSFQ